MSRNIRKKCSGQDYHCWRLQWPVHWSHGKGTRMILPGAITTWSFQDWTNSERPNPAGLLSWYPPGCGHLSLKLGSGKLASYKNLLTSSASESREPSCCDFGRVGMLLVCYVFSLFPYSVTYQALHISREEQRCALGVAGDEILRKIIFSGVWSCDPKLAGNGTVIPQEFSLWANSRQLDSKQGELNSLELG